MANVKKFSPEEEHPQKAFGLAAMDDSGVLYPFTFSRSFSPIDPIDRNNGEEDVTIKILFCGICHSDIHFIKNEWKNTIMPSTMYPVVPGHEIVGIVTETGSRVHKFKVGDRVGVGCLVNSCRSCYCCEQDLENHCPKMILTYNSIDTDGTPTYGGYSDMIVVNEHFVVKFPESLAMEGGAPLLCAGITVYSPLKNFGLNKPGKHIGVVGLGGLGHLAVRFAKAFGVKVTVISTSSKKKDEAISKLGADNFLLSTDSEQMHAAMGTMDGIINTVSAKHDITPLLFLLKLHGKMIMVGAPEQPYELYAFPLIIGKHT
ncbi:hypothetical protein HPP92_021126 [Vanilla planifolia]|uniref:cinnamyl-alcohol dehydrogenase n=1 Tax=Vanilla planifolia TaxID=51239 RepID=A0A835PYB4_VANPL|nr:hypothetical protein HPP92_021458 [Vanilla planifolia]KAG0462650.1 hypothetical protein HPP92_021126 [Vanilla planifolia]